MKKVAFRGLWLTCVHWCLPATLAICATLTVTLAAPVHASGLSKRHARGQQPFVAWEGVVTYVVDGDTLYVRPLAGGKPVSVRIDGIDAPEICQAGGPQAREALSRLVMGKQLLVVSKAHDRYGRLVARISMGGIDQGAQLVAVDQAWAFRFQAGRGPYAALQRRAELERRGLFSADRRPQTPLFSEKCTVPASEPTKPFMTI